MSGMPSRATSRRFQRLACRPALTACALTLVAAIIMIAPTATAAPPDGDADAKAITFVYSGYTPGETVHKKIRTIIKSRVVRHEHDNDKWEWVEVSDKRSERIQYSDKTGIVLAVDDEGKPTAMMLYFKELRTREIDEDGSHEDTESKTTGKSFRAFMRGDKAYVSDGKGNAAPVGAVGTARTEFGYYRADSALKVVFHNRTVNIGERVALTTEQADAAFPGATSFEFVLRRIKTVFGKTCGEFDVTVGFDRDHEQGEITGEYTGRYVIADCGRLINYELNGTYKAELEAPVNGKPVRQVRTLKRDIKFDVSYPETQPTLPDAEIFDPEVWPPDDLDLDGGDEADAPEADAGDAPFYKLEAKRTDGSVLKFASLKNRIVVIVNIATDDQNIAQLVSLQELFKDVHDDGVVILAFPSNDFGNESRDDAAIAKMLRDSYGVGFEIMARTSVKDGDDQHPVFKFIAGQTGAGPAWNYCKYVIGRDGEVLKSFKPYHKPERQLRNLLLDMIEDGE
jgi:glutathione peroxidase